jgi:hypothetical protein
MSHSVPEAESTVPAAAPKRRLATANIWLRELPYAVVLILTLLGVAYTSSKRPTTGYWEFLVPVTGVVCIWSGWRYAQTGCWRLTQESFISEYRLAANRTERLARLQ